MSLFGSDIEELAAKDYTKRHMPGELTPFPWMESKNFIGIHTMDELRNLIDTCVSKPYVALDLETTGLDNRIINGKTVDQIVGFCISPDGENGYYVPVRHGGDYANKNLPPTRVAEEIKRLCENTVIIVHNSTFDLEFLFGIGIEVDLAKSFEDTLILDYLRCSHSKRHGLKHLSKTLLGPNGDDGKPTGHEMFELHQLFPAVDKKDLNFSKIDPFSLNTLRYACADAINTFLLYENLKWVASEQKAIYQIEKSCVAASRWMERNRPTIAVDVLTRMVTEIETFMLDSVNKIYEDVIPALAPVQFEFYRGVQDDLNLKGKGYRFHEFEQLPFEEALRQTYDVTSPKQLGDLMAFLFKHRSLTGFDVSLEMTGEEGSDRRQVATASDNIERYVKSHGHLFPFLTHVNTYRTLQKVLGTYVKPLMENINPQDNTTRFSFNGFTVDTGRFSASKGNVEAGYSGINVQSMPACYNVAKFPVREIESRPAGHGVGDVHQDLLDAINKRGFIRRVHDGHFMLDLSTGKELCVRSSCEDCPFLSDCIHGETHKRRVVSLESSARLGIVARDKDHILVASDESGVELRVAANASQEPKWVGEFFRCASCGYNFEEEVKTRIAPPNMCPSCESDKIGDLHTLTCQIVYGADIVNAPDFKQYRQSSKGANFALLYGGGPSAVQLATGLTKEESRQFRDKFLAGLPTLNRWFKSTIDYARKHKEVSTLLGRKIRLEDIDHEDGYIRSKAERNAINSIIQGSATGDLTKYAMARVYAELKKKGPQAMEDCKLILTVHDELVFDIRKSRLDEFIPLITGIMTELATKMNWPVPLKCDVELGPSWDVVYNWDGMHVPSAKTGLAHENVPDDLVNYIQHKPGMWVKKGKEEIPLVGPVIIGQESSELVASTDEVSTASEDPKVIQHKENVAVYTFTAPHSDIQSFPKLMDHILHFMQEKGMARASLPGGVSVLLEDPQAQSIWGSHGIQVSQPDFEVLMEFLVHLNSFNTQKN